MEGDLSINKRQRDCWSGWNAMSAETGGSDNVKGGGRTRVTISLHVR